MAARLQRSRARRLGRFVLMSSGSVAFVPATGANRFLFAAHVRMPVAILRAARRVPVPKVERTSVLRSGALLSSATLITASLGLVRSKIVALAAGPAGVGLFAQMNQLGVFLANCCSLGLGTICVKLIAEARQLKEEDEERRMVALVLVVPAAFALIPVILSVVAAGPMAGLLLGSSSRQAELRISIACVPLNCLLTSISVVLLSRSRGSALGATTIIGAVVSTCGSLALILFAWRGVLAYTVLLTSLAPVLAALVLYPDSSLKVISWRFLPSQRYRRAIRGPAALTALGLGLSYGADTLTRGVVLHQLGPVQNGYYQPIAVLRNQLLAPLVAGIVLVLLPTISQLLKAEDAVSARREVEKVWRATIIVLVPVCVAIQGLRQLYVFLAFSAEFSHSERLILAQMPVEVLAVGVVILNAVMLPAGRTTAYFLGNFLSSILQVLVSLTLLPSLGLYALVLGTGIGYATAFCIYARSLRHSVILPSADMWLLPAGVTISLAVFAASTADYWFGQATAVITVALWPILTTTRDERRVAASRVRTMVTRLPGLKERNDAAR